MTTFSDLSGRYEPSLTQMIHGVFDSFADDSFFANMTRYPMGWVDETGQPYSGKTGKRIRPLVVLLSAEATSVTGDWQGALPVAAAVEILHNFSLVHDDIQDRSDLRHNRPTVWKVWGVADAINVGDAIFALAYRAIEQLTEYGHQPATVVEILKIFNQTILDLTKGQYLDMSFERTDSVAVKTYLEMIRGKTAVLLGAAAQMGAYIGSQNHEQAIFYREFGVNIGLAFQVRDDILGIWGKPEQTGKSAASDIITRKKTLPVLYGLAQSPDLATLYAQGKPFQDADVAEVVRLLGTVNAHQYANEVEQSYYNEALRQLELAKPSPDVREQFDKLIRLLFGRLY